MKKLFLTILLALSIFTLASCHYSSFHAVGLVQIQTKETLNISFFSFKGRLAKKIEKTSDDNDELTFDASLSGSGEVTVYYEIRGEMKELFSLKAGETKKDKISGIMKTTQVYIIIEAPEEVEEGSFSFSLK